MKIAFIYPSFGVISKPNQPNIKAVADNYGIYPNTSLLYVAGAVQSAGHECIFLDAMARSLSINNMIKICKKFKPEVLMFTLTTYLFHENLKVISYFKKQINAKIVVGGQHLSLYPVESLRNEYIDIGIIGEAEESIVELLDHLGQNKSIKDIKGIVYKNNDKIFLTNPRLKIKDLDKVPFPARNLVPMDKYYSFISKKKNYTILMSSRGCTFQCSFCEQRTGDVRYRSAKNVADEFEECFNNYGVREIDVFDPLFTINKKRVIEICKEIQRRDIKIIWSCRSRVDTIDEDMLNEMKKAGCYRIYFGIESGDETILKNIKKYTKLSQIKRAIYLTKKHKILAFGYFMFGNPGDNNFTIRKTINLAKSLPLDYAQFNRVSFLPGTGQYDELKKKLGYDYWEEYIKNKASEKPLPRLDCNLTDDELDTWIKKAYIEFYFRPKIILKTFMQIKSLDEIIKYSKAGLSIIFG
jgi:anaerobic magnesium-protoporphyrin IX monomethyl ester cyclase